MSDESGPLTIDGFTQPTAAPNTAALASNAAIRVGGTNYTPFKYQSAYINTAHGITNELGAAYNTIGGTAPADRNVVSGNGHSGITTYDEGTEAPAAPETWCVDALDALTGR